ncbi:MAG TPA: PQQ-binding-like beta-propeller repeat protein [Armatimonadota bacterium]|nr:PQQ-binding-like beta-propeller repeat protein [Armatimonadota bacterium]
MRLGRVCLILTVALIALAACAQDEAWLPRYDESNSGVSPGSVRLPVSLRWQHTIEDETSLPLATPAVGPDMIYAPVGETIYAIDRRTGELVWEQSAGDVIYSSPALAGDTLYFGSRDNNLWAISATNGEVKWRYPTGGPVDCSPVIAGNLIYFGSDDNRLVALDLDTHQALWQFETRGDIKASPLVYRDVIVVGSQDRHIYCLNLEGRPMWSQTTDARAFFAAPTAERTKVIYGCGRELIARELYSGRRLWRFKTAGMITGAPCVRDRRVYVGTAAGSVYCIDASTGRGLWRYPADGVTQPINSAPTVVGDMLVFRAGLRQLVAVALRDATQRWVYSLPEPPEKAAATTTPGEMGGEVFMPEEEPTGEQPADVNVGGEEGRRETTPAREYKLEESVEGAVAITADGLYVIGNDNIVYAFWSDAADNTPPWIRDPILDVPGRTRTRVTFSPNTTTEDDFPEHYADEIVIPGTPPIFLSMMVSDEGSGVDPDRVKVTVNDEETEDYVWDAEAGVLWYIFDPRGAAANLSNGVKSVLFEAVDWRGNRAAVRVSFTVDNKAKAPEPPKPVAPMGGEMGPGGEFAPPEGFIIP